MKIQVYTGYDKFCKRGEIEITYDRIAHIRLYLPDPFAVRFSVEREVHIEHCKKTGEIFKTHHIYKDETDYKFALKKLSKADLPYRKGKLTHQIMSKELTDRIEAGNLYTKLSWFQSMKLNYGLRNFFWQTREFKKHIYFHIATHLVTALLTVLGTVMVMRGCDSKKPASSESNKPSTRQTTQSNKDTTKQPIMKNDSMQRK